MADDYRKFVDGPTLIFQDRADEIKWGESSTQVRTGVGATFNRGDGLTPEEFWPIAEVTYITGPSMSREVIDVTSLNSPGGYKEFICGMINGGKVEIGLNFTVDSYTDLDYDFENDSLVNYEIHMADDADTIFSFSGIIVNLSDSISVGEAVTASAVFDISGYVVVS